MANITTENINTLAQLASSIGDGDYIYIYKASSGTFARIEKSLLMQAAGGISDSIYTAIKGNVNKVQATLDLLLSRLANMALTAEKPNAVGTLVWPSNEGGGSSAMISLNPSSLAFPNTEVGDSNTMTFYVIGSGLTGGISLSVTGDGFSCSPTSIPLENANSVTEVTVEFEPLTAGNKVGTIVVSSTGVDSVSLYLTGRASESGEISQYSVTYPSDSKITHSGGIVNNALSVQLGISTGFIGHERYVIDDATVAVSMGGTPLVRGTGYTLANDQITINNVTGDVVISAEAKTYVDGGNLKFFLDCKDMGNTPGHWIDKVGGIDFTLHGTSVASDGGIVFDGTAYGSVDFGVALECAAGVSNPSTVEGVFTTNDSTNYRAPILSNAKYAIHSGSQVELDGLVCLAMQVAESGTGVGEPYISSFFNSVVVGVDTLALAATVDRMSNYYVSIVDHQILVNGEPIASNKLRGRSISINSNSVLEIGQRHLSSGSTYNHNGKIYAIRAYDRSLTESEQLLNYKIDKKLYGI